MSKKTDIVVVEQADEPAPAKPPTFEEHVIEARRMLDAPEPTVIPFVLHHIISALELASAERAAK
jgi:hypothetical protein